MNETQIIYVLFVILTAVCIVAMVILVKRQGSVMKDLDVLKNKDTGMIIANVVKEKISKDLALSENQIDVSQIQNMKVLRISDSTDRELCSIDFDIPQNYSIKNPLSSENKYLKNLLENILGEGLRKSDVFYWGFVNTEEIIKMMPEYTLIMLWI